MARDGTAATGATNHYGELLTGRGSETHPGLIVSDGAVIPTSLGVNPFATITALAERSLALYMKKNGLELNTRKNRLLNLFGEPRFAPDISDEESVSFEDYKIRSARSVIKEADQERAAGVGFTEVMTGFLHSDEGMIRSDSRDRYEGDFRTAQSLSESARFFLSVQSFDTRNLVRESEHSAMLTGSFCCPTIQGSPFMVQRGDFNLFVVDDQAPGTRNLAYDFDLKGVDGRILHFHGYKVVDSSVALAPLQFWKATSTLFVTITEPKSELENYHDERAWRRQRVVARGILRIQLQDFATQILTMTPTGSSLVQKVLSAGNFLGYFTRKSLSLFLAPLTPLQFPTVSYKGYINETKPDASFAIVAGDGIATRMHMWEPTHIVRGKVQNLFFIPGAAVDHQVFALPTIPYNAVNYFTRAGYRVFVTVHRIGQLMVAQNAWTTYDARLDIKACLEYIRAHYADGNTKDNKMFAIAHCMGSVAFSTGLLDGTIPASWILGISCSQVFMNPIWGPLNMAKVMAGPVPRVWELLNGTWFSCSTSRDEGLVQQALNQLLRLYPSERKEICNNASCHRCSFVFGRCWNHGNLNEVTHRQIDRFFGGVNTTQLRLLMRQGYEGHVMNNEGVQLTTHTNIRRLRGVPVHVWVGRDNAVLSPEATSRTYETLCNVFGGDEDDGGTVRYRRNVVRGYGHLDGWMGRWAWRDVYPMVRAEVDRVVWGEEYVFEEHDDWFGRGVEGGYFL